MKLNNKGFAITSIIYSMLILFLTLVVLIIGNLANRKAVFDKQKEDLLDKFTQNETEEESELPSEYQKVEYIEGTGTQYIDTEIHFVVGDRFNVKYTHIKNISNVDGTGSGGENKIFGAGTELKYNICGGRNISTDLNYYRGYAYQNDLTYNPVQLRTFGNIMEENVYIGESTTYFTILNTNTGESSTTAEVPTPANYDSGNNVYLFRDNSVNYKYPSNARIFMVKHYRNDVLVRDYIPCYRKSDGEIGMYDTVNNKFYTNVGTGTFSKGPNV